MDALPDYVRNIVATAIYTGMCRAEVLGLIWDRVDLDKRLITLEAPHIKTNMRRSGVHDTFIMKISGHSTREMFDRHNMVDGFEKVYAVSDVVK